MGFVNGFVAGIGVGFIILGVVFIGLAYQVYSVRVEYGKDISKAYSLTHSEEYNALIKLLDKISTTGNTTIVSLSMIPGANKLLEPLISLMMKAGEYKNQLVKIQQATEKLSTDNLVKIESLTQMMGILTIILGTILITAGAILEIRERRRTK